MDLWVVAVAASAGCLAKYWQNLSKNTNSLPELSPGDSNCGKPESPGHPFHRLAHIRKQGDGVSTEKKWISDERVSDIYQADGASAAEVASTSGFDVEKLGYLDKYEDHNVLSVLSVLPKTSTNDVLEHEAGNGLCGDTSDNDTCGNSLVDPSAGMGSFHGFSRNRSSLRPKCNEHFSKPLSSLESCLMAQLYKEHTKMENYVFSSLPSPAAPTMRPLLGTAGSQILGGGSDCCFSAPIGFVEDKVLEEACLVRNENVSGIPPLPKIGSLEFSSKMKRTRKDGDGRLSSSIKMAGVKNTLSQGSQDGINLFCLGIYFGILSSFKTNKREVDSLKEKLKQTQNFIQDLQDELDMKDSMIVKELANESYKSKDTCDNSCDRTLTVASPELSIDISTKYDGKKLYDQSVEESSEPMSKIEAELEAELERLELNMNASSLDRRFSDLVELHPEFVADFAQGDLRADMIHGQAVAQPKSNQDVGDTSTPHSGSYAVSPRELSLRLHEVIQCRLEEQVQELEAALQNSQRQLNRMQSVQTSPWNEFSSYERGYSSTPESSIAQECNPVAQPLIMNLSGETLDAYNEACIEKIKAGDSEYQDLPSRASENKHQESFKMSDRHAYTHPNGGMDGSMPHLAIENDISSMEFFSCKKRSFGGHMTEVQELNDVGASEDEKSDWDDEFEKQLIKQIVEKSKKGSPVILNAQRVLFLMDEK
ncbi:hypothetical protein I3843_11G052500 [Carya illinoinensis]|uniref:Uncharacterized protein n=1 Tax=Carya illinoinensis TaxID=32201 RepID=A0A922DME6_CARIL|nr:hypothetical protein I3842_11G052400 [Carya illinoinensis]KAG6687072.1 hypothetical protein I3842_11G052400 [Carya illinoinensis]KAG7955070.1 hypothetical protein I3843_11G052500 [Carya illinoinensis]KAG7955071.1 hypothetical protein I3843_11G052500 [Carya illinoinensis]